jgi:periplasmic protein TonB
MFDSLLDDRTRRRPFGAVAILVSALAHVAVGTTLVVLAMWQLDKLAPESRPLVLVTPPDPTAHARPPQAAAPPPAVRAATTTERRRARPLTQPSDQAGADEPTAIGPASDGDGDGIPSIHGGDDDCLTCSDGLPGDGDLPPETSPKEPPVVAPHLLAGNRIAGNDRIVPPEPVRLAMRRADQSQVVAVIKMCLASDGRVRSLEAISSSGYPQYDAEILREMRAWRYRPYEVDGAPVPVCTAVTFVFRLQR